MSGIGPVNITGSTSPISAGRSGPGSIPPSAPTQATGTDEVEISQHGQLLSQLISMPEIRQDKVASVREAIANDDYESDEKVDLTIEGLFEDLREA